MRVTDGRASRSKRSRVSRSLSGNVAPPETTPQSDCGNPGGPSAHEGIDRQGPWVGALTDEDVRYLSRLLSRISIRSPARRDHAGHSQVGESTLSLLEEQHEFVAGPVVVAQHARNLVPDQRFPEPEPGVLGHGIPHKLRHGRQNVKDRR